jgi:hypothetical protein
MEMLPPRNARGVKTDSFKIECKHARDVRSFNFNMDLNSVADTLNELLGRTQPLAINRSWIRRHAPRCYRFIQQNLRREFGGIDWDRLSSALDWKYQRRWRPLRARKKPLEYEDRSEVQTIYKKYHGKMYVFIAPSGKGDRRTRDLIGISFVRLAQKGNLAARQEVMGLLKFMIDDWIERHSFLARWRGHEDEIQNQLVACIRRYRYTGSFVTYVFRTLECAGRGIRPTQMVPIDHRSESRDFRG